MCDNREGALRPVEVVAYCIVQTSFRAFRPAAVKRSHLRLLEDSAAGNRGVTANQTILDDSTEHSTPQLHAQRYDSGEFLHALF